MSTMYGKAFASMYEGSMFGLPATVFAVWGYVLAKQRPDRARKVYTVELNPAVLAATFATPEDEIVKSIKRLCDEDPRSRTPDEGGRRLVPFGDTVTPGPTLYRVVNGAKYAAMRDEDERRAYLRDAKRAEREKAKQSTTSTVVNNVNRRQPPSTQLESYSEVEEESESASRSSRARDGLRPQGSDPDPEPAAGPRWRLWESGYQLRHERAYGMRCPSGSEKFAQHVSALSAWSIESRVSDERVGAVLDRFFADREPKILEARHWIGWLVPNAVKYLSAKAPRQQANTMSPAVVPPTEDESQFCGPPPELLEALGKIGNGGAR